MVKDDLKANESSLSLKSNTLTHSLPAGRSAFHVLTNLGAAWHPGMEAGGLGKRALQASGLKYALLYFV